MIELSDINLIAKGNQRATYFYPDDSNKLIKIDYKKVKNLTKFLDNLILFNEGMRGKNVLIRKKNEKEVEFVLIDGLGDDNWFRLPNLFKKYLEKKIVRRWNKFYKKHIKEYEEKETAR
ncbi:PhoP regulatory network YrbL family protein [Aliarcobacter cryaerophilus]|uniref:PhoP regulatory network YrbL family protein n=1 Tax=Aliarcobacter cryaerophilus TaxID=28198 RepID=UPI0021B37E2E|nr:PhoP regulatory network YrbL family protein [Aliarcobacter cryaerophilus]MCT7512608.1 PhoP regulatory network YrbL family protein [Aliarcobacter cryaerophilus]